VTFMTIPAWRRFGRDDGQVLAQDPEFCRSAVSVLAAARARQLQRTRRVPATRRTLLLGLVAAPLILAGCAATGAPAPAAAPSPNPSAAAAAQAAGNTPPAAAQMVCGDEIRSLVTDYLGLDSVPAPQAAWVDQVYTCTYSPPMGPLVLSVTVAPTDAAAVEQLTMMRGQLGAGEPETGLGQQAYSAANGTILAVKDNMVLRVDATGLPDDLGGTHERRIGLARYLAAVVFSCWTGAH
jgi:hypothetical protein